MLRWIKLHLAQRAVKRVTVEVEINAVDLLTIQAMILSVGRNIPEAHHDVEVLTWLLDGVEHLVTSVTFTPSTLYAFARTIGYARQITLADVTAPVGRVVRRLADDDPTLAKYLLERLERDATESAIAERWGENAGIRIVEMAGPAMQEAVERRIGTLR